MMSNKWIVLVAVVAGLGGLLASAIVTGPKSLLDTEIGQRMMQRELAKRAPPPPAGIHPAERGNAVAPFTVRGLDDAQTLVPTAFAGRRTLVNIWATWCGPCRGEMPELEQFHKAQGDDGVQVVGIALDDAASVRDFITHVPVSYRILLDDAGPSDAGVRLGNVAGVLPYSVLLSPDGMVLKQRVGVFAPGEIAGWATP